MPSLYVILKHSEDLGDEGTYRFLPQYDEDVGRATGNTEIHEDFISNLSRICSSPVTICFYLLRYKI
jgi:hypothetical protein